MLPTIWWRLVAVVDEQTIILRSEKGETRSLTLACIGRAKDGRAAKTYVERRLRDHKVIFWPLETPQTNWYERPMCIMLDMDLPGRGGDGVNDFPTLNEELLRNHYVPFADVSVTKDPYNLKARLSQAGSEGAKRKAERDQRWEQYRKGAHAIK